MRVSPCGSPGLKPRGSIIVAIMVVLCVATALSAGQAKPSGRQPLPTPVPQPATALAPLDKAAELWVDQTFKKMALDDKAGQMVMSGIDSTYLATDTDQFDQLLEKVK